MVSLFDLWLPVLLAAVFVFVASSVIHMALPLHKSDFKKLPDEEQVLAALRQHGVQPGHYMFPLANSMKEMCSPEMVAKQNQGPVGHLTVMPNGPVAMGRSLALWLVLSLVISAFTAYVAGIGLGPGADAKTVFRLTCTVALLGYSVTHVTDSIWKGLAWNVTAKFLFDGLIYALVTGATFAWQWPAAAM